MNKLRMKRHESFHIREGWFEKAIHEIEEKEKSIFGKTEGIKILGIGANMVKSLRYWLIASRVIEDRNSQLSNFGEALLRYDPYLESDFSWWFIHGNIVTNYKDAPVFNIIFNSFKVKNFSKADMEAYLKEYFKEYGIDLSNFKMAESDIAVLLRTYIDEIGDNPEDNLNSPLGKFGLISGKREKLNFQSPTYNNLDYLVVYYFLEKAIEKENKKTLEIGDSINIDDLLDAKDSPAKIFRLDKNLLSLYLNDMKQNGLVTINRTAGLNMIYIQKLMTLEEIFEEYFVRVE